MSMIRLLFQGDSITDGNRYKDPATRWDLNHQIGHCYVYPITGKLRYEHPGKYQIINRGVSGDSVETIMQRWQRDTLDEKPDIISLLLGINGNWKRDGRYPEGVSNHLSRFESKYRWLLDTALASNPDMRFVLIEPFALPVKSSSSCCEIDTKTHFDDFMAVFSRKQEIIRHIAEDYNAVYIPIQEDLNRLVADITPVLASSDCPIDPCAYWLWDGVHPTEPMHWYIAQRWLEAAVPLL